MIHTVFIDSKSEYDAVKKEFRKCLMTGGAVVRIREGLTNAELLDLKSKFIIFAKPHNVASMIIREVEKLLL